MSGKFPRLPLGLKLLALSATSAFAALTPVARCWKFL
jgi:hypothetical protein